ncbi:MAG: hypothetical protein WA821_17535 [Anaerolineales bacterium]
MSKSEKKAAPAAIPTPAIYQNPFMAPNDFSEIHMNSYQTDTCSVPGPATATATLLQQGAITPPLQIAGSIAFNTAGQIITIRVGPAVTKDGVESAQTLLLVDADTLKVLAELSLPPRPVSTSGVSFSGGGYFYLNHNNQVVCVTATQQIRIYSVTQNGSTWQFVQAKAYDLSATINNQDDILNSVIPDSAGNLWFITHLGVVGYVKADGSVIAQSLRTEWPKTTITKSFASDGSGRVLVVTDEALFCFTAATGAGTTPQMLWRSLYDVGTRTKLGQNQRGCGTTPTCFDDFDGNQFVAIANNANRLMEVCVYNRQNGALVAKQEVFGEFPYISSCENSLIAVNHSILIENNYNNVSEQSTLGTLSTVPGINRVDFDPATGQSKVVWANNDVSVPSVVSQLSTGDGCLYTYAKSSDGWYWAALDFATGKIYARSEIVPWSQEGSGALANNFYSGLTVGPKGSVYVGVLGGIVAWRPNLGAGN